MHAFIAEHHSGTYIVFYFYCYHDRHCSSSKICNAAFLFMAAKSDGRTNHFQRCFLWFIVCSLGVFLLIRTYPFWESILLIKVLIIILGLATSLIAASIARVQSTVKTQIAYSSITQIGLIFIEVALGFHTLALIHFAGNAFLRTYQLLVSPSVLSYQIHDMVFNFNLKANNQSNGFFQKIKNAVYILSIKEWNLDWFMYHFLWNPFKWMGRTYEFFRKTGAVVLLAIIFLAGLVISVERKTGPFNLIIR